MFFWFGGSGGFEKRGKYFLQTVLEQPIILLLTTNTGINAPKKLESNIAPLYRTRETKHKCLETFIENKELLNPKNVKIARCNLSKDEKKALKEIKSWDDEVVRVQDKGSRFVILENEVYEEKIQQQIDRSSFKELKDDPSKLFQQKINNWIEKWYVKNVIDNSWKDFISCDETLTLCLLS